ncbi:MULTISPECIES: DUF4238 domain-containing protein [Stenotrophomonas]|uniref:DUF4238 domain-containing protein n=1 Tax=Stenotrophomonas TaxID=40323 RepID=UPI0009B26479|nr:MULTISPECIES: DUF4238 domain-containing protein [Stenotrophomonas]MBH1408914.1 DUF4238 domain-containing protein [Stenotrophomonas maltophilia]MCF3527428.1 DUF4238 domain-containing protein [Stenotrophomonas maltophilia]MCF3531312.1 DUF4238 domain-containing protein [Stenotrophomonas maltophilia]HDS1300995.1 DUF4238 domain-containing protein [Stenotrophomonas maltophilia]
MSGRKQHYLPQFLQRPFSHRVVRNNYYVHVHEQRSRYSPSTTGVGAIRDFYSTIEDTRADDNITANESILGGILDRVLRTKELPESGDISMLFGALSIRTLKMRNAMEELAPAMISTLRKKAAEQAWALEALDEQINDAAWIDTQIDKQLQEFGMVDRNRRAAMRAIIRPQIKRELESSKPRILEDFNALSHQLFDYLESKAATIANGALSRVFTDTSALDKRSSFFDDFSYTLVETTEESFVLGDCAVAALDSQSRPRVALGNVDKRVLLDQIFLPISPDLLIHGARTPEAEFPGSAQVNRLSAMLSNHFFISLEESTIHIEELKKLIGAAATPIVSLEELASF